MIMNEDQQDSQSKAEIIWFTGLSGSGKTTLANALCSMLKKAGRKVVVLDGDAIRQKNQNTNYTKEGRIKHLEKVAEEAQRIQKEGITVIASLITPYQVSRDYLRSSLDNYTEIYLSTPIEVCEQRDEKGLYKKARNGEIDNFTGISAPYEVPQNPDLVIDTSKCTVEQTMLVIIERLYKTISLDSK